MFKTIAWSDQGVVMIDQRKLPVAEEYPVFKTYEEVAQAIKDMVIRGAPAIGVAAAMGVALGAESIKSHEPDQFENAFESICETLEATRPTAANLFWAIERMKRVYRRYKSQGPRAVAAALKTEALHIHDEDIRLNRRMGGHGADLLQDRSRVLTHCNAGALATAGYGTALGVIRAAVEQGKRVEVLADETRPFLQGARLNRLGAAKGQYSGHSDHRQHGGVLHETGPGGLRHCGSGSDRCQWGRRQQNRHLFGRRAGQGA